MAAAATKPQMGLGLGALLPFWCVGLAVFFVFFFFFLGGGGGGVRVFWVFFRV